MENPRSEKVAVVDEVRERLGGAAASVITEYRGLSVTELAELRRSLAAAGGDYKIFKNTLVRLAVAGSPHEPLTELLTGPTAIAFVHGELSSVAKALRDFSRSNPHLVVKGGLMDGGLLGPSELASIADLPSRDVLLARVAGAIAAPMTQLAGLFQALPRNLAYGLSALLESQGGGPVAETEAPPAEAEAAPAPEAGETATTDAPEAEAAPAPEAGETATTPAPEAEAAPAPEAAVTETTQAPEAETAPAPEAAETETTPAPEAEAAPDAEADAPPAEVADGD